MLYLQGPVSELAPGAYSGNQIKVKQEVRNNLVLRIMIDHKTSNTLGEFLNLFFYVKCGHKT